MEAVLSAGAIAILMLTSIVSVSAAAEGAPTLLAQRSRGRGAGSTEADARSLIRGRVVSIDTATGRVALDVSGTILELTLPPTRIDGMKPGDVVFITVNLIDTRIGAISGSVTSVDPQRGTLTVATPGGSLTVTSSVTTIQPGDAVILKLDVVDIGPPFELSPPAAGGTPRSDPVR